MVPGTEKTERDSLRKRKKKGTWERMETMQHVCTYSQTSVVCLCGIFWEKRARRVVKPQGLMRERGRPDDWKLGIVGGSKKYAHVRDSNRSYAARERTEGRGVSKSNSTKKKSHIA